MDSRSFSGRALVLIEGEGVPSESNIHAFLSAAVTLTLGILGSSVLPVPFAFSRSGVLLGLLVSLLVGSANSLTGTLLLRAAGEVQEHTFEAVAGKAAGRFWKLLTEVSMVLLLFGTLCGDYALLADCGKRAIVELFPDHPPWITSGDGRIPMVVLGLFIVFPLSCMRRIRSLEYAAMAGVGLVFVLAGVIAHEAISTGFPAIKSGELPLVKVSLTSDLPEAVAIFSFAFYVQPMLLPLLREMPAGRVGVDLTCKAVQLVTLVVAFLVYSVVGVFAASRYGLATEGDILVNHWLPGRWEGALAGLVAIYLSLSMVPMVMTMRYQLDSLVTGQYAPFLYRRDLSLTVFSLLSSLAVALQWPTAAEKMFAVTGASAVCLVCYVIPVVVHLSLYFKDHPSRNQQQQQRAYQVGGPAHPSFGALPPGGGKAGGDTAATAAGAPSGPTEVEERRKPGKGGGHSAAVPMRPEQLPRMRGPLPLPVSFDDWLAAARSRGGSSGDSFACGSLPQSPVAVPQVHVQQQQGEAPGGQCSALESMRQLRRQYEREQQLLLQQRQQEEEGSAAGEGRDATALSPPPPQQQQQHAFTFSGGCMQRGVWPEDGGLEEPLLPPRECNKWAGEQSGARVDEEWSLWCPYKRGGYPSVRDLEGETRLMQAWMVGRHVALPVTVMIIGTAFSLGSLLLSLAALIHSKEH